MPVMAGYRHILEARLILEKGRLRQRMREAGKATGFHFRNVPHFTLVYSFDPRVDPDRIIKTVADVSKRYDSLDFMINGFELREARRGHVFAFNVEPSRDLVEFRRELYDSIKDMIDERGDAFEFNNKDDFWFHVSIAIKLREHRADVISGVIDNDSKEYGNTGSMHHDMRNTIRTIVFPSEISRITLLRNSKIYLEYDRLTDRILHRREALSRDSMRETLGAFRKKHRLEKTKRSHTGPGQTWVISDTHFDHGNIIKYTGRPFANVREMNGILLSNWNNTVHRNDRVCFLGDMAFGRGSRSKEHWIGRLNGRIIYVRGNHDTETGTVSHVATSYRGHNLLFVHDPDDLPISWDGWIVHGDKHNNRLGEYPLVNTKRRTINVCSELIRYSPINLDRIIELIDAGTDRMLL